MKDTHNLKLEDQLCFAIYSTSLQITQSYKPLLSELNITYPQFLVLLVLWEQDGINLKTICGRLRQKPGALTPVIKRLESLGFLRREPSLEDERSICICLTDEGHELKERATEVRDSVASVWAENKDFALFDQLAKLRESLSDDDVVS